MADALAQLLDGDLRALTAALRTGRLGAPFSPLALSRFLPPSIVEAVASELNRLVEAGLGGPALAAALELILSDRARRSRLETDIYLVTTGPEAPGVTNRDTSVVVRDLFAHAEQSVLVAGYAIYQGQQVFRALAERMQAWPDLRVRMFLDVKRGPADTTVSADLVRRFAERFRTRDWPGGARLPEVFYDPRSLETAPVKRASLHAKCVVVDGEQLFVSSANFTEAAQERNIEVGLLVRSKRLADQVERHFQALLVARLLEAAF